MPRLNITAREAKAAHDVLTTVSAYTYEELQEHFEWDDKDIEAWASVLAKMASLCKNS